MNYFCSRFLRLLFLIIAGFCLVVPSYGQAVDPNFYPVITNNDYAVINASAVQADGKVVIAGAFGQANGFRQSGVARLLPNGKTDETFQPVGLTNGNYAGFVYDLKIQPDGKILIAGNLSSVNGQTRRGIARLNTDGSLDTVFAAVLTEIGYSVNVIELQPDGKILVGGGFPSQRNLIRLNNNGTIDTSFQNALPGNSEVTALVLQTDGNIIAAYQIYEGVWKTKVARLNSNGGFDSNFSVVEVLGTGATSGGSPTVDAMLLQADGKIIVSGSLTTIAGVSKSRLARLNSDGTLDNSFQGTADAAVFTLQMQADGKILAGGIFSQVDGIERKYVARFNPDGSLDDSLNASFPGPFTVIQTISIQTDGKIIIGGQFLNVGGKVRYRVARLNSDGTLDDNFAFALIGTPGLVSLIVPRTDGKIFAAGSFSYVGDESHTGLVLINRDGSLDKSFQNVNFGNDLNVYAVLPLPDNRVLVAGHFAIFSGDGHLYNSLVRLNPNGTIDTAFPNTLTPSNSSVSALARQPDGKILLGGLFTNLSGEPQTAIIRINADGSPDTTFHTESSGTSYSGAAKVVLQPDGKILIGGYFTRVNGVIRNRIARLNSDGSLDTTFQNGMAGFNSSGLASVLQIELQPDGKMLVAGEFDSVNGTNRKYLVRLNPDGSLDEEFLSNYVGTDNLVTGVAVERSGKILIAGSFVTVNGTARRSLAQLNTDGSLDPAFSVAFDSGAFKTAYSLAVESNGNVLVGGSFGLVNSQTRAGLFRIINSRPTKFDFDGDGKADVSVFRPDNGAWYLNQSSTGFTGVTFGFGTDKLVPADYDGDGKADVAVYRNGTWYIQRSSLGFYGIAFGDANDIPVPADYDGDGKADIAVFRPSNGTWYLLQSTAGFTGIAFGQNGDKPVPADYDGDGKTDITVNRSGAWYLNRSTLGFYGVQFGDANDKLVPADYDGDGKADIAVFRPSNGTWYLQQSTAGFTGIAFGLGTDIPVPGDYDGDGKADVAVVRNGTWYLNRSTQGFTGIAFGTATDLPIPNAFIR